MKEEMEMTVSVEQEQGSDIQREEPQIDESRRKLVKEWTSRVQESKEYWKDDFKRMREDMQLAYAGADDKWMKSGNYVVPIIARHINQIVAALYAKNPTPVVSAKRRVENVVWDGREDSLKAAMDMLSQAMQPPQIDPMSGMPLPPQPIDPMAQAIVQEAQQMQQRRLMLDKICKTMEILLKYYMDEQEPSFKKQLKQLVRRTKTCGVGYVFLGYQRILEKRPEIAARLEDVSAQLARMESLQADMKDGLIDDDSPRKEELRLMMEDLQSQLEIIVREGPVFDFPRSTEIIIDKKCIQLNGLIGAEFFAREFHMKPEEIEDIYKIDVRKDFTPYQKYTKKGNDYYEISKDEDKDDNLACVWEVWCKTTGQTFTIIEGYCDFAKAPAAPEIRLERFWPLFVLTFNDVEHETKRYPLSDAHILRHTQAEYNRSREIRRLHRISNTPKYIVTKGRLPEDDKIKLSGNIPFSVIELNALAQGESVEQLIQVFKPAPIDPALYETNTEMEDVFRTVGSQEANIGGTSGATATEVSVGEQSRSSSLDSNIDDLNMLLSEVVRSTGQMMLLALDIETVKKIAGPGAEWPQMSREEICDQVMIDIEAGSSGRPNSAAQLAMIERAAPFLMQMNDVSMKPLGRKYAKLLDLDPEDMIVEGMPSQVALNAMASKLTSQPPMPPGAPMPDQASQGAQGGNNAPAGPGTEPGPQPEYPVAQFNETGERVG
jgi:hypothetical protein